MENSNEDVYISTTEALWFIEKKGAGPISLPTLINWLKTYKIGKKIGGRWQVNKAKLFKMLKKGNPNET